MSNTYKPGMLNPEDYRNPWETAEKGFWVVHKKDGCTSMRKINAKEGTEELASFYYAMAVSYDVMINEILNLDSSGKAYSISDIALKTIDALGKKILEERKDVGI